MNKRCETCYTTYDVMMQQQDCPHQWRTWPLRCEKCGKEIMFEYTCNHEPTGTQTNIKRD